MAQQQEVEFELYSMCARYDLSAVLSGLSLILIRAGVLRGGMQLAVLADDIATKSRGNLPAGGC